MATRSAIITINPDGESYSGIYSHSDGYPAWLGHILLTFFNTQESAHALIALGDISQISRDGEVTAYHRDCGENKEETSAVQAERPSAVAAMIGHDNHIYVFECGRWRHNGDLLTEVLTRPEIAKEIQILFP